MYPSSVASLAPRSFRRMVGAHKKGPVDAYLHLPIVIATSTLVIDLVKVHSFLSKVTFVWFIMQADHPVTSVGGVYIQVLRHRVGLILAPFRAAGSIQPFSETF